MSLYYTLRMENIYERTNMYKFIQVNIFEKSKYLTIFSAQLLSEHTYETKVIKYSILDKELLTASFHILVSIRLSQLRFHFNQVFVPTEWLITCKNSCKPKEIIFY